MGFVAVLVYSGIGFVDNLRNLRFPASAAGLCRVRGSLNLDICCVRGVNSLSRGLRRASSLWEGANPLSLASLARFPLLSPTVTSSPGAGEVFPLRGSFLALPESFSLHRTL